MRHVTERLSAAAVCAVTNSFESASGKKCWAVVIAVIAEDFSRCELEAFNESPIFRIICVLHI